MTHHAKRLAIELSDFGLRQRPSKYHYIVDLTVEIRLPGKHISTNRQFVGIIIKIIIQRATGII